MSKYACRDDNYSLKPLPPGKMRQDVFCPDCPSGPHMGAECLHGHSYETKEEIKNVVRERLRTAAYARNVDKHVCLLCGYPVDRASTKMHKQCAKRVTARLVAGFKMGWKLTEELVIQRLIEEGLDNPPA